MRKPTMAVLAGLLLTGLAQAAEEVVAGPLQPHPCTEREKVGTVQFKPGRIWRLVLQEGEIGVKTKAMPTIPRGPLNLTLFERDGVFTGGYAAPEKTAEWGRTIRYVNAEGLRREGDALQGKVTVVNNYETIFLPRLTYELEAKVADGQVAGTYKVTDGGHYSCANPGAVGLTGNVAGKILEDAAAGKLAPAWIAGADWPCWRGPQGNGTAVSVPGKTIANWSEATPLWWSEAFLLSTCPDHAENDTSLTTTYTSPVVADGRVYFHMSEPDPCSPLVPVNDNPRDKRWRTNGAQIWGKKLQAVARASLMRDVVYCFDAQTGRTLWKRIEAPLARYPGQIHVGSLLFSAPCATKDRIYVILQSDVVICLDAVTGALVWQTSMDPARTERIKQYVDAFLQKGTPLPTKDEFHTQAHPAIVDAVMVCPRQDKALVGLDIATGKQLWTTPDAYKGSVGVSAWKHGGQEYALTGHTLLDAKTGKILWRVDNEFGIGVTANATHMMGYRPLTIYEISPKVAKSVWTIGDEKPISHNGQTAGVICGDSFINMRRRVDSRVVTKQADGSWQLSSTYPHQLSGIGASAILNDLILPAPEGEAKKDVNGPLLVRHDPAKGLVVQGPPLLLEHTIATSMAVASGRMFLRVPGGIVCYDLLAAPKPGGDLPAVGPAKAEDGRVSGGDANARLSVNELRKLVSEANEVAAVNALAELDGRGKEAAPAVPTIVERLKPGASRAVVLSGVRALATIGAPAVPALVGLLESEDPGIQARAAVALVQLQQYPDCAGGAMKAVLRSEDTEARKTAIGWLAEHDGLDELAGRFKHPQAAIRLELVGTLLEAGPKGAPCIPILRQALRDGEEEIASTAAEALLRLKADDQFAPEDVRAMTRLLRGEPDAALLGDIVRVVLVLEEKAVPGLVAALQTEQDMRSAWRAARLLGELGPKAISALPAMREATERFKERRSKSAGQTYLKAITDAMARIEGGGARKEDPKKEGN